MSAKVNVHTPHDLASSLLIIPLTDVLMEKTDTEMFKATLFTSQRQEITVVPPYHGMPSSNENEQTANTCKNTEKSHQHNVEGKKPETKEYIRPDHGPAKHTELQC